MNYLGEIISQENRINIIDLENKMDKCHEFYNHQLKYNEEDEKMIESMKVQTIKVINGDIYFLPHWEMRKNKEIAFLYLKYGNKSIN